MTGKNKKRFEEWYKKQDYTLALGSLYYGFYSLNHEMQIGVVMAYYGSIGIDIKIHRNYYGYDGRVNEISINDYGYVNSTRKEAQREALKQSDILANKTS
jgi:hypothetical protein